MFINPCTLVVASWFRDREQYPVRSQSRTKTPGGVSYRWVIKPLYENGKEAPSEQPVNASRGNGKTGDACVRMRRSWRVGEFPKLRHARRHVQYTPPQNWRSLSVYRKLFVVLLPSAWLMPFYRDRSSHGPYLSVRPSVYLTYTRSVLSTGTALWRFTKLVPLCG